MKINCNLEELKKIGVYIIINLINNKVYVGSSVVSILKRMWHHQAMLRLNKHKNSHLQRAFNKYLEENFEFNILELCDKDKCLEREQYWIDYYQSYDQEKGYNINPKATGTPSLDQVTIDKRSNTFRIFQKECKRLYKLFKNKELKIEEIPKKYRKMINSWCNDIDDAGYFITGHIPWNKGKDKTVLDYSYLKVPKTITKKLIEAKKKFSEDTRNKLPNIYVYDLQYNFLGVYRCAKDIEEFSITEKCTFPIQRLKIRNTNPRLLSSVNINKSCKTNKMYKSLYFSYKPLHQVIDVNALDKLLENPVEDNQQPTTNLNV